MAKNIIKEIIIILLLALAIILILGVLLYEYVPMNKIIPEKVSYTTPENIKQELQKETTENNDELSLTYNVESSLLNNYQKIQEYVPGKKNPFQSIEKETTGNNNNNSNNETSSQNTTNNNTNNNANNNTNNDDNTNENTGYIPNKGTK